MAQAQEEEDDRRRRGSIPASTTTTRSCTRRRRRPTTARGYANRRAAAPETGERARVIFDVDGTLVDSNDAHARAWVEALEESGHPRSPSTRVRPLIGMGGDKLLPEVTGVSADSARGRGGRASGAGTIFRARYLPHLRAVRRRARARRAS